MKGLKKNHFISRLWRNIKSYGLVFLFLGLVILITWYVFYHCNFFPNIQLRIAGIISFLGLGFGLFQFWFNHITTEKRRTFDLRYTVYKELMALINSLTECLHEEIYGRKTSNASELVKNLSKLINKIDSAINENNNSLFPKIKQSEEARKLEALIFQISYSTFKYEALVVNNEVMNNKYNEHEEMIAESNWFNDVREPYDELEVHKSKFYEKLREYLR